MSTFRLPVGYFGGICRSLVGLLIPQPFVGPTSLTSPAPVMHQPILCLKSSLKKSLETSTRDPALLCFRFFYDYTSCACKQFCYVEEEYVCSFFSKE